MAEATDFKFDVHEYKATAFFRKGGGVRVT